MKHQASSTKPNEQQTDTADELAVRWLSLFRAPLELELPSLPAKEEVGGAPTASQRSSKGWGCVLYSPRGSPGRRSGQTCGCSRQTLQDTKQVGGYTWRADGQVDFFGLGAWSHPPRDQTGYACARLTTRNEGIHRACVLANGRGRGRRTACPSTCSCSAPSCRTGSAQHAASPTEASAHSYPAEQTPTRAAKHQYQKINISVFLSPWSCGEHGPHVKAGKEAAAAEQENAGSLPPTSCKQTKTKGRGKDRASFFKMKDDGSS